MASTLITCANTGARPGSPSAGDTLYQIDTNQIILWDGSVWQVYDSDNLQYATSNELNYTGNEMGFTTVDGSLPYFCPQPLVHFNATYPSSTGTTLDVGTAVATWADTSGNNNDAVQASATYQGVYYKDSANRGFVACTNDSWTLGTAITIGGDFTQIFVGQRWSQASGDLNSAGGSGYYILHARAAGTVGAVYKPLSTGWTNETVSGAAPYLSNEMWTAQRGTVGGTANTVTVAIGGNNVSSPHTRVDAVSKSMVWLGKSGSYGHDGQYYEMLHWDSALGVDDLNRVRLYLTNKYGLTTVAWT
jgi:hypothetical protein